MTDPVENLTSNWNFARDFPRLDAQQIERPHFLETIAGLLDATPVVFLEGDEGDGATTTLAQFCQRYPEQTFSLFIKPASRFAYSLDYLRLALTEQFHWYVYGKSFDKPTVDQAEYMNLVYKVRKKKKNATLYIVVDGLHQIQSDDAYKIEEIFREVLPLGIDHYRFVIVGQQEEFLRYIGKVASKPYQQLKFRLEDTELFLAGTNLSKDMVTEVYKVCKGVPGRIASVKRLLNAGEKLDDILGGEPSKYLEFIKLEFAAIERLSDSAKMALAVLTFAKRALLQDELSQIANASADDLAELGRTCTFLNTLQVAYPISFVSESHRRFAERQLLSYQKKALSLQVDFLLRNPSSENALRFLPTYYQQLDQQQAIIDLITTEHYTRLLESTQSISALRNRANLAIRSANQLKAATEVFKFSLQQSIFGAVGTQEILSSEVDALVALNQTDRALELASDAMLKEDRLRLLATYCKGVKSKGGAIDSTILSFVRQLGSEIDFAEHPDTAVGIAADILFFEPDLAIDIVERANKRNPNNDKQDSALLKLSITATLSDSTDNSVFTKKSGKLISDSSLQKFTASLNAFTEQMPMGEVINTAAQMDVMQRIIFLRSVISVRRKHKDVLDVVDYALDVLIKESHYTPKSKDLADFCVPLPIATVDSARLEQLIDRFDAQVGLISNRAVSKDLVVFQMRLAHAQLKLSFVKADERITQTYYDVCNISTPETRAECLSIMLNMLGRMDLDGALEASNGFQAVIQEDLRTVTKAILEHTADHLAAVEGVIRSVARNDHTAAFELSLNLNTEYRRNRAFILLLKTLGRLSFTEERKAVAFRSLKTITAILERDAAILGFHRAMEQNEDKDAWIPTSDILRGSASSADCACECALITLRIKCKTRGASENEIIDIHNLIEKVDSRLTAINFALIASEILAQRHREKSIEFFDRAQGFKAQLTPNSERAKETLERCILLISRISQPIIKAGLFDEESYVRFSALVETLPGIISQIVAYADLAARGWCVDHSELTKRIIQEKCVPLIEMARKSGDEIVYFSALRICFPLVRSYNSVHAFDMLSRLPTEFAEEALYEAALFIIRKITPYDPFHSLEFDKFLLHREDLLDLWSLIERHETDTGFYSTIAAVIDAVCSRTNRLIFTGQQRVDFYQKLQRAIAKLLPDKKNIQHDGYKISSQAQALRLIDSVHEQWMKLAAEAKMIVNHADRGYVLIEVARCMPAKYDADKRLLFAEALSSIDLIPSPTDRLSHYESYASVTAKDSAAASTKEVVKRAILLSTEMEASSKVQKHRRNLMDIAERLEAGLADEIVELIDDDPARASAKRELLKSADLAKVKRTLANAKSVSELEKTELDQFATAAWKNFSALVSGRLEVRPIDVMIQYLLNIKAVPLEQSYGMYMWYVENLCRKYSSGRDLESNVLPLSEALMLSTEMAATIMRCGRKQEIPISEDAYGSVAPFMIAPGDREKAIVFLREWLEANADGYIKFCDSYFGPGDVDFLRIVLGAAPTCNVKVLTSKKHLKSQSATTVDAFEDEWTQLCDQNPPETEIIALGVDGSEDMLIHDRWLLTKGAGLRLGTSFNSLGITKISEISEMDGAMAATHESNLDRYFEKQRTVDGLRVSYWSFIL